MRMQEKKSQEKSHIKKSVYGREKVTEKKSQKYTEQQWKRYTFALVEMAEKRFLFQLPFCKLKYLNCSYYLCCTCVSSRWKPKNEIFICYYILFLKNIIRAIL